MTLVQHQQRRAVRRPNYRASRPWSLALALAMIAALGVASSASALIITGGPTYTLPGGGSCTVVGETTRGTGATVSCTGISLSSHTKVYFGLKVDTNVNGHTMTGSAPAAASAAVFRSSSTTANSISYTSTTSVTSLSGFGTDTVSSQLVLTRTSGTASVVATGGTPANNTNNGDIGNLFQITSGSSLTLDVDVFASDADFALGQACPAVYDPSHASPGALGDISKVDVAFYYSDCGDGQVDSPEQCDAGVLNGTAGSCCSTTCTFKASLTPCTDDGIQCTSDQCNGASAICQHPNKVSGSACTGNGSSECSNADTCNGSGVCLNNDVTAGTACTDTSLPSTGNCKDAQCNGVGVCDQNFANELNGTVCVDGLFCNGTDQCNGGTCSTHAGNPCPGQNAGPNCNDSCNEALDNCTASDVSGTSCAGNGVNECSGADTCNGGGSCLNNDVSAGTPCIDTAPPSSGDCKDAQCNGSGTCDQSFANETNGIACDDGFFCDGTETCSAGTCTNSTGNPCPGPDNDTDCSESCNESANDCTANDADGTTCRPDAGECDVAEQCASGSCPADAFEPSGTGCGSSSDTNCDNPDTCDGGGSCQVNNEPAATPCGDPSDTTCTNPDTCDGGGSCQSNHEPNTVVCRAATTGGLCDEVENCDGTGNCPVDGFQPSGTPCRAASGDCDAAEVCSGGSAFCPSNAFQPASTPCGDPTDTDCDNPDSCDGNNTCLANLVTAGTSCGDPTNTTCDHADTCNGSGICLDNLAAGGTACGSPSDTECTDPDTCDGAGVCLVNHAGNGSACDDGSTCTTGEACLSGVCTGGVTNCPLDHYKCYQGKDLKNPKFVKQEGINTTDQLATNQKVDAKKLKFVCTPVDKNGEGINDPNAHLACYQLKAQTFGTRPKVEVSTQFQTSRFEIKKGKLLCLPASKTVLP